MARAKLFCDEWEQASHGGELTGAVAAGLVTREDVTELGGSMRLGAQPCHIVPGTRAERVYGEAVVYERHRHRYEVNQEFKTEIEKGGLTISGTSPDGKLVEYVEAADHHYFVATQAHPEFRSRPTRPHPMFAGLIRASKRG